MEIKHFPLKENIQAAYLTEAFRFTFFCVCVPVATLQKKNESCALSIISSFEVFLQKECTTIRNFVLFSPLS